jgi:hypothetical protein
MERDRDPYGCESDQPGHEVLIVLGQGHREEERQRPRAACWRPEIFR